MYTNHCHDPEHVKRIINRLSRATGHLDSIKKMVKAGTDCSAVLIQLAAVKSAINGIGRELVQEHMTHCIVAAIRSGDNTEIEALNAAIQHFLR